MQPNLFSTIEKHHLKQKSVHDNSKSLIPFTKGETIITTKGNNKMDDRKDTTTNRTVSYLVTEEQCIARARC